LVFSKAELISIATVGHIFSLTLLHIHCRSFLITEKKHIKEIPYDFPCHPQSGMIFQVVVVTYICKTPNTVQRQVQIYKQTLQHFDLSGGITRT
jgi:hypothetical protein